MQRWSQWWWSQHWWLVAVVGDGGRGCPGLTIRASQSTKKSPHVQSLSDQSWFGFFFPALISSVFGGFLVIFSWFLVPLSLFFLKKSNYQPVNHKMEGELSITTSFGHCLVLTLVAAALCVIVIIFSISKILLTSGATNCDKKLQQARMADYQLHTTKPISATKVAASNFWRESIQIPSSAIFSTFLLSVWRETRTRVCRDFLFRNFDASNNCFCTVAPPSCPLLQKRLVKLATTIKATVTATSLNFLSVMPNNLGGKRSDTTAPKKGRWEKSIFFLFKTIVPPAV